MQPTLLARTALFKVFKRGLCVCFEQCQHSISLTQTQFSSQVVSCFLCDSSRWALKSNCSLKALFRWQGGWDCGLVLVKILRAHGLLITLICLNDVTTALTLDSPLRLYKMTSVAAPLAHPAAMILRGEEGPVFIQQLNKI